MYFQGFKASRRFNLFEAIQGHNFHDRGQRRRLLVDLTAKLSLLGPMAQTTMADADQACQVIVTTLLEMGVDDPSQFSSLMKDDSEDGGPVNIDDCSAYTRFAQGLIFTFGVSEAIQSFLLSGSFTAPCGVKGADVRRWKRWMLESFCVLDTEDADSALAS